MAGRRDGREKGDLPTHLRGRGAVPAAALRSSLGISRATLSRWVRDAGPTIQRLGAGPATHYGLLAQLDGLPARLPVFRVDPEGEAGRVADLVLLDGGSWLEADGSGPGRFDGLPPFVHEMAPAGYLGRRFARRHHDLRLPDRLQDWSDRHRLIAVARRGEDCVGDLIIGEEAMDRFLAGTSRPVRPDDYPALADQASRGGAGSSAAGEQPKFAAFDGTQHLLVKFTTGDGSATDARWRDLLVCEALAAETLTAHGIPAARATIVDQGGRRFLEVERFDRTLRGRRGVLSMGVLEDEYFGERDDWTACARRLESAGMLDAEARRRIETLDAFGTLIANGDRHFGNLSFFCDELDPKTGLVLAPAYDMLPMDAAPSGGVMGELPTALPPSRARHLEVWDRASKIAQDYWQRVAADPRITDGFRRAVARLVGA